uniref:hypothetical protein n=1 Tax=Thiobacillus sp. TaxID=924 RepID=UPI00159EBE13|nr:hypothetical protein [Thiobacillus sp.]
MPSHASFLAQALFISLSWSCHNRPQGTAQLLGISAGHGRPFADQRNKPQNEIIALALIHLLKSQPVTQ